LPFILHGALVGASSPWPKNFYQFSKVKNGTRAIENTKEKGTFGRRETRSILQLDEFVSLLVKIDISLFIGYVCSFNWKCDK